MKRLMKYKEEGMIALLVGGCFIDSTFNVDSFAQGQFEGENDTRYLRIPPKDYRAQIAGPWNTEKATRLRKWEKDGKSGLILDVVWQPEDPAVQAELKVEKLPTIRQSVFLDLTDAGTLDMGPFKNGDLGRLRTAIGLNNPGQRWSFADFVGKSATVKVEHKPNPQDVNNPYQNITAVTSIG